MQFTRSSPYFRDIFQPLPAMVSTCCPRSRRNWDPRSRSSTGAWRKRRPSMRRWNGKTPTHRMWLGRSGCVWKCLVLVPRKTQWFCWSLSLWKMAISLGIYPIFRQTQVMVCSLLGQKRGRGQGILMDFGVFMWAKSGNDFLNQGILGFQIHPTSCRQATLSTRLSHLLRLKVPWDDYPNRLWFIVLLETASYNKHFQDLNPQSQLMGFWELLCSCSQPWRTGFGHWAISEGPKILLKSNIFDAHLAGPTGKACLWWLCDERMG